MQRVVSRILPLLILTTMLLVALTACQAAPVAPANEPAQQDSQQSEEPESEESGVVELRFWTFLDPTADDPRGQALKQIIDNFHASQSNIRVNTETIHWSTIDSQVIQATAAGAGPDIINIYSVQLPQHVAAGTVQPINSYVEEWRQQAGQDYSFPTESVTYNGDIMALPWETRVWLLLYRQDLLEEAGLEVPTTLEELAQVGGALREQSGGNLTGLAIGYSEAALGAEFMEKFEPLLWGAEGQLLDDSGEASFAGPEGVQAMEWLYAAVHEHEAMGQEVLSMTADDVLAGLQAGTIGMAIQGSMRVGAARNAEATGDNLMTAPVPGWSADAPLPALVAGQTLAIGANTDQADAAWAFIEHYLSTESQLLMAEAGVMPVMTSVLRDPSFADRPEAEEMAMWLDYAGEHGRMGRYPEDFAQLSDIIVKAAQQIVFNNAPLQETLEQAQQQYNSLN